MYYASATDSFDAKLQCCVQARRPVDSHPMREGALAAAEKVVEDDDVVTEEHEPVYEVRADKAGAAGDEDAFLLGAREFANGRVGGPAREGDGGGPVVDGLRGEAVRGERVGTAVVMG